MHPTSCISIAFSIADLENAYFCKNIPSKLTSQKGQILKGCIIYIRDVVGGGLGQRGAQTPGGGFFGAPKPPWGHFRGAEGASKIGKILLFHRKNQYFGRKYALFMKIFQIFFFQKNFSTKECFFRKNFCRKNNFPKNVFFSKNFSTIFENVENF